MARHATIATPPGLPPAPPPHPAAMLAQQQAARRAELDAAAEAARQTTERARAALPARLGAFWEAVSHALETAAAAYSAELHSPPLRLHRASGSGDFERLSVLTGRADGAGLAMTLSAELACVRIIRKPPSGGEGRLLSLEELDVWVGPDGVLGAGSPAAPLAPGDLAWYALHPLLDALGPGPMPERSDRR